MPSFPLHDPPGFLDELTPQNRKLWSELISSFMLVGSSGLREKQSLTKSSHSQSPGRVTPQLCPQFYDATKVHENGVAAVKKISWTAFPRKVSRALPPVLFHLER